MNVSGQDALNYYNALRKSDTHKGDYGRVYILAGTRGMTGAGMLCAKAALRSGAGLVYMLAPGGLIPVYETGCPEAVKIPLDERGEYFTEEHVRKAAETIKKSSCAADRLPAKSAVVVGPGMGQIVHTKRFVHGILDELAGSGIPVILDADGLNAYKGECERLRALGCRLIITPHAAELSRLTGMELSHINSNRTDAALKAAELTGAVTVLKGSGSITASILSTKEKQCDVNTSGNPGMATGGSGDVLSGVIAGIAASDREGLPLHDLVKYAVYIHGLCADIAAERFGQRAVIAGDLIDMLKEVHHYGV